MLLGDRDGGEGLDFLFVCGRGARVFELIEELKGKRPEHGRSPARLRDARPAACKSAQAALVLGPDPPLGIGGQSPHEIQPQALACSSACLVSVTSKPRRESRALGTAEPSQGRGSPPRGSRGPVRQQLEPEGQSHRTKYPRAHWRVASQVAAFSPHRCQVAVNTHAQTGWENVDTQRDKAGTQSAQRAAPCSTASVPGDRAGWHAPASGQEARGAGSGVSTPGTRSAGLSMLWEHRPVGLLGPSEGRMARPLVPAWGGPRPYLRDDGVQPIGPPGVVHRVGVQDTPGQRHVGFRWRRGCTGLGGPTPPTHQGPRPRLGMVAGVMMPLTSCWMILEQQGRAVVSSPRTGAIPGGRTGTVGPASQVIALKGCAFKHKTRDKRDPEQRLGPKFPARSPQGLESTPMHVTMSNPHFTTRGLSRTSGEARGQCSVQSSSEAGEGPNPPLRMRQDPVGAFSFCPVLLSTQEGLGLHHRAGTPAHCHHGTRTQSEPRQ